MFYIIISIYNVPAPEIHILLVLKKIRNRALYVSILCCPKQAAVYNFQLKSTLCCPMQVAPIEEHPLLSYASGFQLKSTLRCPIHEQLFMVSNWRVILRHPTQAAVYGYNDEHLPVSYASSHFMVSLMSIYQCPTQAAVYGYNKEHLLS